MAPAASSNGMSAPSVCGRMRDRMLARCMMGFKSPAVWAWGRADWIGPANRSKDQSVSSMLPLTFTVISLSPGSTCMAGAAKSALALRIMPIIGRAMPP